MRLLVETTNLSNRKGVYFRARSSRTEIAHGDPCIGEAGARVSSTDLWLERMSDTAACLQRTASVGEIGIRLPR